MTGTDQKTDKYLKRIAARTGFIYRDYTERTTEEVFNEADVPLYSCGKINIGEHGIARIYNFPAGTSEFSERFEYTNGEDDTEFHYAVGLPTEADKGRTHITLLFDELPDKSDIKTTWLLCRARRAIECNTLNQHFVCRICSQRKHWVDVEVNTSKPTATFRERLRMCQHQVCSQTALNQHREELVESADSDGEVGEFDSLMEIPSEVG